MDKLFIFFMAAMMLAAGLIMAYEASTAKPAREAATTTSSAATTTTMAATSTTAPPPPDEPSTTLPPTTTVQPTTTTLGTALEFETFRVDKCRDTVLGKMNTVYARLNSTRDNLTWGGDPRPKFALGCDGAEPIPADFAYARGEGAVEPYSEVAGEYRLAVRCGRNTLNEDLADCGSLTAILDVRDIGLEAPAPTTTTLRQNPYLDRFRDKGYRMAEFHVAWLCPSCVPAVNKLVMETPGVKSRSLSFGQDTGYVIYDPRTVSLDKVLEVAGAGGDLEDVTDREI